MKRDNFEQFTVMVIRIVKLGTVCLLDMNIDRNDIIYVHVHTNAHVVGESSTVRIYVIPPVSRVHWE